MGLLSLFLGAHVRACKVVSSLLLRLKFCLLSIRVKSKSQRVSQN